MSIFVLKIIALIFMVVDHIKYAFPACYNEFTLYFGRIAFPIFAFCVVQGYLHTRDLGKYLKRLLIAGIISEIPFLLFESLPTIGEYHLNIEFTLILGIIAIKLFETYGNSIKGWLAVLIVGVLGNICFVDYGMFGVLLIFSFYIFKDSKFKTLLASMAVVSGKYLYRIFILGVGFNEYTIKNWICTLIPLFLLLLYNGKKGAKSKWLFYIFYPAHLLILWLLSPYTFNLLNI